MTGRFDKATWTLAVLGTIVAALLTLGVAYKAGGFPNTVPGRVLMLLLGALTLIFVSLLLVRAELRVNALLAIGVTGCMLYVFELILCLQTYWHSVNNPQIELAKMSTRMDTLKEMRNRGVWAYPILNPQLVVSHFPKIVDDEGRRVIPLAGISSVTTVQCNESGTYSIYESDERGFNNPRGTWNHSTFDVVAIGDSFVNGACVPPAATIAGQIRARYPATLNLGIGGQYPLMYYAYLREYLPHIAAKNVFVFFWEGNDYTSSSVNPFDEHIIDLYLQQNRSQGLLNRQDLVDAALQSYVDESLDELTDQARRERDEWLARLTTNDGIFALEPILRLAKLRILMGLSIIPTARDSCGCEFDEQLYQKIFVAMHALTEARGARLYLVYMPLSLRLTPEVADAKRRLFHIAGESGIKVIDTLPRFLASGRDMSSFFYYPGSHYNPDGYALVAEEVLATLDKPSANRTNAH